MNEELKILEDDKKKFDYLMKKYEGKFWKIDFNIQEIKKTLTINNK